MQIGKVIRSYRKQKNMTQEEVANRLGVTASAVNKWEKGASLPDISLLAPIARLLGVTLETLLSFQASVTADEIAAIVKEIDIRFRTFSYGEVFQYAKELIQTYPDCHALIWQLAVILDARRTKADEKGALEYEKQIKQWYMHALESGDADIKRNAAESLFQFYVRKGEYEAAGRCLSYFSKEGTQRKQKQALLYAKTGQKQKAYEAYEEILFSECQTLRIVFSGLYMLALEENDLEQAGMWAEKESGLVRLFEMGKVQEAACKVDLAVQKQDVEQTLLCAQALLAGAEEMDGFQKSAMYAHMKWKSADPDFLAKMRQTLLECFRDPVKFKFMEGCGQWELLIKANVEGKD